ncbi:MAG TPA: chemotaxis protein CheW [Capillimicrobium sp.]
MDEAVYVRVHGERYALPVGAVREVETRGDLTPVPGAPAAIVGIRNLRGSILPVVELAGALGLGDGQGATIVVTEAGGLAAGLAVDEVIGVEPLPDAVEPADDPALLGRALVGDEQVGVIDAPALLRSVAEAA